MTLPNSTNPLLHRLDRKARLLNVSEGASERITSQLVVVVVVFKANRFLSELDDIFLKHFGLK